MANFENAVLYQISKFINYNFSWKRETLNPFFKSSSLVYFNMNEQILEKGWVLLIEYSFSVEIHYKIIMYIHQVLARSGLQCVVYKE